MQAWIIAEQTAKDFRIQRILQSQTPPLGAFREGVIEIIGSYDGRRIAHTTAVLFAVTTEAESERLLTADQEDRIAVFNRIKALHGVSCRDIVSTQRAAWCYRNGRDVLESSFQNGGGSRRAVKEIDTNPDFRSFIDECCESKLPSGRT